jgi:hypothetical protein
MAYARKNDWSQRVAVLVEEFEAIYSGRKIAAHA